MLAYRDLNEKVRLFMVDEIDHDTAQVAMYLSPRLSAVGLQDYPSLLREAAETRDDRWLEWELGKHGRLNATEQRRKKNGGFSTVNVPYTAPQILAEGEFNRYYVRGLCRLAMEEGIPELTVYRAKEVENPRSVSQSLIGTTIGATALLDDLRTHQGVDTALRLPPGPNSGLSVCLPQST